MKQWVITTSDKHGTGRKTRTETNTLGVICFLLFGEKDYRVQINLSRPRK